MKPIAALSSAALLASLFAPVAQAETLAYAPGTPLYHHTLPNGLNVLLLPLKNAPVTTVHLWVGSGSRDEKPGITGIAHLFEHMMFRPVKPGEPSYFDKAAKLGMEYNASTRFNATDFYDTFTPRDLPTVLKMEANRFENLHVTPEMLKVEREAVRSEYSTKFDANPMIDLWFWVYRYAYGKHPYGWHIVGYREDLDAIKAEDCNRFFQANYKPNNTLLAIAGPIDPTSALSLVKQNFANWQRGPAKKPWSNVPPLGTQPVEGAGKLPAPSKYMLVGYRSPERTAPDRLAEDLAESLLFNGKDSLVSRRLIDEKHMASVADAFNTTYDIGLRKVLILPNPGVTHEQVYTELQAAIDSFARLPEADFNAYREAYSIGLREGQLKTHDVTNALGHAWAYDGDFRTAYTDAADVLKISRAQVADVIRRIYRPANRVTAYTP